MSRYSGESEVRSAKVKQLSAWWHGLASADIPDRRDVDPAQIKALLPYIVISDVERAPFRIRYRLVGTKVVEATGFDFTHHYLDQLVPVESDEPWMQDYAFAYQHRSPVFGVSELTTKVGAQYAYEFALFPLRNGAATIDQFIAIEDYFDFSRVARELDPWRPMGSPVLSDAPIKRLG